jgi:Flp pilus assembly pilin Flp
MPRELICPVPADLGELSGVTPLEYAFIAGRVAIAIIITVATLGGNIDSVFGSALTGCKLSLRTSSYFTLFCRYSLARIPVYNDSM